eukprot:COSAG06_NODE_6171_length_3069_cov_21.608754_1_plen_67_part_10
MMEWPYRVVCAVLCCVVRAPIHRQGPPAAAAATLALIPRVLQRTHITIRVSLLAAATTPATHTTHTT